MKIIYPFKNSGLYVWPISQLSKASQKRLSHTGASYVVKSNSKVIYALAGDEDSANEAMNNLMSVKP